jgi:tRNA(Ile)-lysidine synthase
MRTPALVSKVRRTIARRGMIKPGETILVACSGGADSTALLYTLHEIRGDCDCRLAVAHFDHSLRAASGRDAVFVHGLAADLELPFYLEKQDVRAGARARGLNLEEAARLLRYDFLRRTAASIGAGKIATGHTLDDQAETVLMRLLRGSGPRGLSGIAPVIEDTIIRPLIDARRSEIETYLRIRGIAHLEDETNQDRRYRRNDIRHRLLPYIKKYFEPAIVEKLGRLADVLIEEDRALDVQVQTILPRLIEGAGLRARLNAAGAAKLPAGLARRGVRAFVELHKGDLRRISFEDIENIRRLAEGKTCVLPGGIRLSREGDWIRRSTATSGMPVGKKVPRGFRRRWDGAAPIRINSSGAVFSGRIARKGPALKFRFDDTRRVYLDADRLVFPLVVRSRREGDRYHPLGAPGRKKLTDLFREKGIPVGERGRRAVFVSGGEIAWVEGLPAAESFKIGSSTRRVFVIEKKA